MTRSSFNAPAGVAALATATLTLAACGSSGTKPVAVGPTAAGPGAQVSQPPWKPEYRYLVQRLAEHGIPQGPSDRYHTHALLHIYVNGLLSPIPTDIGLPPGGKVKSTLHTHDSTGVIHMESPRPHKYTLGDFFAAWGVRLAPDAIGGLKVGGANNLYFYVNGRPLRSPVDYVMHNNDNIVIGYGAKGSFPITPDTTPLKEVEGRGGKALACSTGKGAKGAAKSCTAPAAGGSASKKAASGSKH